MHQKLQLSSFASFSSIKPRLTLTLDPLVRFERQLPPNNTRKKQWLRALAVVSVVEGVLPVDAGVPVGAERRRRTRSGEWCAGVRCEVVWNEPMAKWSGVNATRTWGEEETRCQRSGASGALVPAVRVGRNDGREDNVTERASVRATRAALVVALALGVMQVERELGGGRCGKTSRRQMSTPLLSSLHTPRFLVRLAPRTPLPSLPHHPHLVSPASSFRVSCLDCPESHRLAVAPSRPADPAGSPSPSSVVS